MRFAINPATTMPYDLETDVAAYQRAGIRHMELWIEKLDRYLQNHTMAEARDLLERHGISLVSACSVGGVLLADVNGNPPILRDLQRKLELCRDLRCPVLLAIPDFPAKAEPGMYVAAEANLRSTARIAADYGVRIALEFLQGTKLVATLATAKQLVRGAGHPSLGITLDLSHFWMDRSHVEDITDLTPDELLMVHVDDMRAIPPELSTDYDRIFPGQGRGIDRELIPRIAATGYDGFWSVEIFNRDVWAWPVDRIVGDAVASIAYLQSTYGP
jgi:4-hydroxyphenylpyruvate dioxygenase